MVLVVMANVLILFPFLDLPVFWPFLLFYFVFLLIVTIKKL